MKSVDVVRVALPQTDYLALDGFCVGRISGSMMLGIRWSSDSVVSSIFEA